MVGNHTELVSERNENDAYDAAEAACQDGYY